MCTVQRAEFAVTSLLAALNPAPCTLHLAPCTLNAERSYHFPTLPLDS